MKTVAVVILVYKPQKELMKLLDMLKEQEHPIREILLINTEKRFFDLFFDGMDFSGRYPLVRVIHIKREAFDHAATRQMAMEQTDADYVVMMTMDAVPADEKLIGNLLRPLEKSEKVAVAYARQLAKKNASLTERFTRSFNYPERSEEKSKADLKRLGIRTYFCSDVCCAYKREIFFRLGGFTERAIFNEDMIYAATAVRAGYSIYYAADAQVYHSHDYTGRQQLQRNFDNGVSQAEHPEVFADVPAEKEGVSLVAKTFLYLLKKGAVLEIFRLIYVSGCKYVGFRLGKAYRRLPRNMIMRCTSNQMYFRKQ